MLHDIGKYRVPAEILAQPQDLTEEQYEVVKSHAVWGGRLLREIPSFELASQVARWHHERWTAAATPTAWPATRYRSPSPSPRSPMPWTR